MDEIDATESLHQLSGHLSRYYGKKVIILLDEYDKPMEEAYMNGYWEEMSRFMRSLLLATFKVNPDLYRALLIGLTTVGPDPILCDFNNSKVVTTTSRDYAKYFGFTQEEVFSALEEYGLSEKKDEVKAWYGGFAFGEETDIYNPWSIANYLKEGDLGVYWAGTSTHRLVGKLIQEGRRNIKQDLEVLLQGAL